MTWVRLYRGRVWHVRPGEVGAFAETALCGSVGVGEEQEERPPYGGKPCPECVAIARRMVEAGIEAGAAWAARQFDMRDLVPAEIVIEPDVSGFAPLVLCGSINCHHSCCEDAEHQCGAGCPCAAAEAEAAAMIDAVQDACEGITPWPPVAGLPVVADESLPEDTIELRNGPVPIAQAVDLVAALRSSVEAAKARHAAEAEVE